MRNTPEQDKVLDIEARIIDEICERRKRGLSKYGVGVERTDLTRAEWLQHAKEEALDLAIYLERCLSEERCNSIVSRVEAIANSPNDSILAPTEGEREL